MRLQKNSIAACIALSILVGCGTDDVTGVPVDLGSIEVSALDGPVPVPAEGETQVVYEIKVFNPAGNASVRLAGLTVTDGSDLVASYSGGDLQQILSAPDLEVLPENGRLIYLWLSFPAGQVPATLTNTVAFANTEETRRVVVDVVSRELTAVGSPLEGDGWVAANIGNDAGHRRAVFGAPEELRLPQRFAIDWVRIAEDGNTHVGDRLENRNYHAYGEPLLAVADGRVVLVQDGVPDNVPGSRAVEITLDNIGGNTVTLELGDATEVFYAHMIPGSIRVSPGDMVQVGDTLGLLGNSGNSDEPHLHIHFAQVYDFANSGMNADGLPFVFESFEIRANRPVLGMRFGEMPLNEAIVRFN